MIHYRLPDDSRPRLLPFYLAMEEWVAARCDRSEDAFFTWQVDPTVIFGRNQQIDAEVDIDYCRAHDIAFFRRKSGGGCVFADRSNVMLSYITMSPDDIPAIFARYTATVAAMLNDFGVPARASGRNDITIGGRKVSGNAFYRTPRGASIVHGTMLFDTDMSHMAHAITPSRSKLASKGVKSVESRLTMLREHTAMTIDEFRRRSAERLCSSEVVLTPADIAEIEEIEKPYHEKAWIMGRTRRSDSRRCSKRIDGVGEVEVSLSLTPDNRIDDINLTGDFFLVADIDSMVLDRLRGVALTRDHVARALEGVDVSRAVAGLHNEQFINLIVT